MTYYINTENTGVSTDQQAKAVATLLEADGYDVAFTRNFGSINPTESCPCSTDEWEAAIESAMCIFPD